MDPMRWRSTAALLAVAIGLVALVRPHWLAGPLLHETLTRAAETRVDASLARNSVTFLSVSGLKAALATIEGSAVGVGFHFELGDLVQPAYDYVDFVWHAFLYALVLLGLYKLLMQTGILALGISLLGAGLLLWGIGVLGRGRLPSTGSWARRVGVLGLAVGYAVPLALLASQLLTERYLEPLRARSAQRIEEAGAPLEDATERLRGLREHLSLLEPGRSLDELQQETRRLVTEASQAIWERTQAFLAYVLVLAVELLLLPFLSAWLIVKALGTAARSSPA
jgi:hypothetical protein